MACTHWVEKPCDKCNKTSDAIRFTRIINGKSMMICSRCEGKLRKEKRK